MYVSFCKYDSICVHPIIKINRILILKSIVHTHSFQCRKFNFPWWHSGNYFNFNYAFNDFLILICKDPFNKKGLLLSCFAIVIYKTKISRKFLVRQKGVVDFTLRHMVYILVRQVTVNKEIGKTILMAPVIEPHNAIIRYKITTRYSKLKRYII